jgi:hypothetical protein
MNLLDLIPGGGFAVVGGLLAAGLTILWRLLANAKQAGRDEERLKEAEAFNENLKRIQEAARARDAVGTDGVQHDPRNRDNRG